MSVVEVLLRQRVLAREGTVTKAVVVLGMEVWVAWVLRVLVG